MKPAKVLYKPHSSGEAVDAAVGEPVRSIRTSGYVALALTAFFTIGAWGFIQPFVPLFLAASGLKAAQIGLATGVGTGLALLVQPLLGHWCDRFDRRRPVMIAAALGSCAAYAALPLAHSMLAFVLLIALGVNGVLFLQAALAAIAGRLAAGEGGASTYAGIRLWGSLGYILVAIGVGLLIGDRAPDRAALLGIFRFGPLLFLAVALVVVGVPDPRRTAQERALRPSPLPVQMKPFLIAFVGYNFAFNGMLAYLSLYLKSLGATPQWIAAVWASGVIGEMLMMSQIGRLSDRVGRRPALIVTFIALPLRLLALIAATTPLMVLMVQTSEAFCFGIIGVVAVAWVNDLSDDSNRSLAQGRLSSAIGLTMATAPPVAGWLVGRFNMATMLATMAAIALLSLAILWRCVPESHPKLRR